MAASIEVFDEDEVSVTDENGVRYGLVVESYPYGSSDEEDYEEFGFKRLKKGTVRVAWHPDGKEEDVDQNDISLADRSLMPGDVVRRLVEGKESQRGYVRFTDVMCHLQIVGTNKVISNVSCKDLQSVQYWDLEPRSRFVTLDSWVGRIEDVAFNIVVRFPDGARCRFNEVTDYMYEFDDVTEKRKREQDFYKEVYYPGQQLRGASCDIRDVQWLNPTKTYNSCALREGATTVTMVVEQVEPLRVDVQWLCCGSVKADDSQGKVVPPPGRIKKKMLKKLKKLDIFNACSTQLWDKYFYTVKNTDKIQEFHPKNGQNLIHYVLKGGNDEDNQESEDKSRENQTDNGAISCQNQHPDNTELPQDGVTIPPTETVTGEAVMADFNSECVNDEESGEYLDVDEDDVSDAESAASSCSNSSNSSAKKGKSKRKGPLLQTKLMKKKGKRVRRKSDRPKVVREVNVGDRVVVEVIHTSTLAEVMWQDGRIERDIASVQLDPMQHLDDNECFFPGDLVVPAAGSGHCTAGDEYGMVGQVDHVGRTCHVTWRKKRENVAVSENQEKVGEEEINGNVYYMIKEEVSVYDLEEHPDYKFRPGDVVVRIGAELCEDEEATGQVYELNQDGTLDIMWASGAISACQPWQLFLVGDDMSDLDDSDEWDSSDTESTDSWETESEAEIDEEDVPEDSEKIEEDNKTQRDVEKQVEASQLLDRIELTSRRVAIAFNHNEALNEYFVDCYKDIIRIYKSCKSLDKILETCFFRDFKLLSAVNAIKDELSDIRDHRQSSLPKILDIQEKMQNLKKIYGEYKEQKRIKGGGDADQENESQKENETEVTNFDQEISDLDTKLSEILKDVDAMSPGDNFMVTEVGDKIVISIPEPSGGGDRKHVLTDDSQSKAVDQCGMNDQLMDGDTESRSTKDVAESPERQKNSSQDLDNQNMVSSSESSKKSDTEDDDMESSDPEVMKRRETKLQNIRARKLCDSALKVLKDRIINMNAEMEKTWQIVTKFKHEMSVNEGEGSSNMEDVGADVRMSEDGSEESQQHAVPDTQSTETGSQGQVTTEAEPALDISIEGFTLLEAVPDSHKYKSTEHQPVDRKTFLSSVRRELKLLNSSLPKGIIVKGYEDRMDLFSVMVVGPERTPYEDGLFFFDVQLPNDYPSSPPLVHYISYSPGQLNPNLYENGKVCVSLLGTWKGRGNEMWTIHSNLLQVLVSIQGLILVSEPYYNEAGYEKERGKQQAHENSRMYNEMAIIKLQQAMVSLVVNPPEVFKDEVTEHTRKTCQRMTQRLESWMSTAGMEDASNSDIKTDFPLLPVSKGFCITLRKHMKSYSAVLENLNLKEEQLAPELR